MVDRLQAGRAAKKAELEMEVEEQRMLDEGLIPTLFPSRSAAAVKKWANLAGGVAKELAQDVAVKKPAQKTKLTKAKRVEKDGRLSEEGRPISPKKKASGRPKKTMK